MTKLKALRLSKEKWEWIAENWDYKKSHYRNTKRLEKALPELKDLECQCGLCEKYQPFSPEGGHEECPLNLVDERCTDDGTLHDTFGDSDVPRWKRSRSARYLRNLLIKLYDEEIERLEEGGVNE